MKKTNHMGTCECGRRAQHREASNSHVCDRCLAIDRARVTPKRRAAPVRPENAKYLEAWGHVDAMIGRAFGL